jgi:hypothetical protein
VNPKHVVLVGPATENGVAILGVSMVIFAGYPPLVVRGNPEDVAGSLGDSE